MCTLFVFLPTDAIHQLHLKMFPEVLQNSASVEPFVRSIWELLGGGKLPGIADDQVSVTICVQINRRLKVYSLFPNVSASCQPQSEVGIISSYFPTNRQYQR
jgi:hypothetical protein